MAPSPPDRSEEEWASCLTPEQFHVLRGHGTERPFSSPLEDEEGRGTYACVACGNLLFDSTAKYHSGCGWPSFWDARPGGITEHTDTSHGMVRIELRCASCGSHLGHRFPDGPQPTGQRFCLNGIALAFQPT